MGIIQNVLRSLNVFEDSMLLATCFVLIGTYLLFKIVELFLKIKQLDKWFQNAPGPSGRHWFYGHLHLVSKYTLNNENLLRSTSGSGFCLLSNFKYLIRETIVCLYAILTCKFAYLVYIRSIKKVSDKIQP